MRILRLLPLLLLSAAFFTSCQKDLSFEGGQATGTLKDDGTGDCLPVTIKGTYTKNVQLDATNYVEIQVDVTQTGSYLIKSDTLNGYSFSALSNFAVTGTQTIKLLAVGKPLAAGVDVFTIEFGGTTCQVNIVVDGAATTTANFTLGSTAGVCTGATINGTYMQGLVMDPATNTVVLNVNVITTGTYVINIPTAVNGVTFSGSGTFTATGAQTVTLAASGTPAAAGLFTFPVSTGTSNCSFDITFAAAAGPGAFAFVCATSPVQAGDYRFGEVLDPTVNTVTITVNVSTLGTYSITAPGSPADGTTFNATGVFTALGPQTVVLKGSGTSTVQALSSHTVSSAQSTGGTCGFAIYWEFVNASINLGPTRNFSFGCDAQVDVNNLQPGYDLLIMGGFASAASTDPESMLVAIGLPTPAASFPVGTYTCNNMPAKFGAAIYTDPAAVNYSVVPGILPQIPGITINIVFSSTTIIEGNFTGQVKDNNGAGPGVKTVSGNFGLRR